MSAATAAASVKVNAEDLAGKRVTGAVVLSTLISMRPNKLILRRKCANQGDHSTLWSRLVKILTDSSRTSIVKFQAQEIKVSHKGVHSSSLNSPTLIAPKNDYDKLIDKHLQ